MHSSLPNGRFRFDVHREGDISLVTMYCGEGVIRTRTMPIDILEQLGEMCRAMRAKAKKIVLEDVPQYPRYLSLIGGYIPGVCDATFGVHQTEAGDIEHVIAFYDEGDESAPVLVLVEEQIDEFLAKI